MNLKPLLLLIITLVLISSVTADLSTNLVRVFTFDDDYDDDISGTTESSTGTVRNTTNAIRGDAVQFYTVADNSVDYILADEIAGVTLESISFWFKSQSGYDNRARLLSGQSGANWDIAIWDSAYLRVVAPTSGSANSLTTTQQIAVDTLYHVVVIQDIDDNMLRVFVNGNYISEMSTSGVLLDDTSTYSYITSFGQWLTSTGNSFKGMIDEVYIWDRALTYGDVAEGNPATEEVAELYNSGVGTFYPFSAGNQAPVITLHTPYNNSHESNTDIELMFNSTDEEGDVINYTLYINNTVNQTMLNTAVGNYSFWLNNSILGDGVYTWKVGVDDGTNVVNSTHYDLIIDRSNPIYTEKLLNGNNSNFIRELGLIKEFGGYWSDNYMFAWNTTIKSFNGTTMFFNSTTGLVGSKEWMNHTINMTNWADNNYTVTSYGSDDHTAFEIPDYEIIIDDCDILFITPTAQIEIVSYRCDGITPIVTKLKDRYTFGFKLNSPNSTWTFDLRSTMPIFDRGELYPFPAFVSGNQWIDFNTLFEDTIYEVQRENPYLYEIEIELEQESDTIEFNSIGGLNIQRNIAQFKISTPTPSISLLNAGWKENSGNLVTLYNSSNIQEVEYGFLNFSIIPDGLTLDTYYLNFTADGNNSCSMGNLQSANCYSYDNASYQWIQFQNNTITSTYNGQTGNQGDSISISKTDNLINYLIDEHYNPNVFKNYDALYNFSNVKWQTGTNQRITKNNILRLWGGTPVVPLDADYYKLDFRVNHTIGVTNALEAYICNSSYTTGLPVNYAGCALVAQKTPSQLQDDGTKFRGIFTKSLIESIGNIGGVFLVHSESNPTNYYYIKTYEATAGGHSTHWNYSTNQGGTWTNLADGYEHELNLNWFYGTPDYTNFRYNIYASFAEGIETNLTGYLSFGGGSTNVVPLVTISTPQNNEIILDNSFPYRMNYSTSDSNGDVLNLTIYYDSIIIHNNLNITNKSSYLHNTTLGTYNLSLRACETGTTDLYCGLETHTITVSNYCSLNNVSTAWSAYTNSTCGTRTKYSWDANFTTCANVTYLTNDFFLNDYAYSNGTFNNGNYTINETLACATVYTTNDVMEELNMLGLFILYGIFGIFVWVVLYKLYQKHWLSSALMWGATLALASHNDSVLILVIFGAMTIWWIYESSAVLMRMAKFKEPKIS